MECLLKRVAGGPLPIELGGHPPQFLEKINEFLKFTIDF